jgi:alpha-amylase/alpha-mannosidase (GH57 family)
MHQPDYRNEDGIMQMPWVFMHAIKDYYDMPWILSMHKNMKVSFNITAPLIEQLELYIQDPQKNDKFFALWLRDPKELQEHERKWIMKVTKSSPYETMVKPFPLYSKLYSKEHCSDSELLDLEVLFILAWCGLYLKRNNSVVQRLVNQGANYTNDDKKRLLDTLQEFISGIWEFYTKLLREQQISIATTPFYHPILPLLIDMKSAKLSNPATQIPKNIVSLEEDAKLQIQKAQELYKKTFHQDAVGFWPAEGAVDEKSVALLASLGIRWIATDEAILYKSLNRLNRDEIYKPYRYKEMFIGFRDHKLSDLIGFEYRYKEPEKAVQAFMSELKSIEERDKNATLFIVLDGENAWEYYVNNGFDFLNRLYGEIEKVNWCVPMTMDMLQQTQETIELPHLAAGSWINGTFDTWVGDSEKTRAWELLYMTKRDYERHALSLDEEIQMKIRAIFLVAESSDWFWWYGNDHHSEFDNEFDLLFRNNLIKIYRLMQIKAPQDLFVPLVKDLSTHDFLIQPQADISPTIDGKKDSFFEWMGCGVVDESHLFSTMQRTKGIVTKIYYGQDRKKLYFAFEGVTQKLCKKGMIRIIIDPLHIEADISLQNRKKQFSSIVIESACDEWLELSIDKTMINIERLNIRFEIEMQEGTLQTLPSFGDLQMDLNDDYSKNWFV